MNNPQDFSGAVAVGHEDVQKTVPETQSLIEKGETLRKQEMKYCTAVSVVKPRQLNLVKETVMSEVQIDPASCYFLWEVKNRRTGKTSEVCGPTIGLEMSIARNFGNCAVDIEVQEYPDHYLFTPAFLDLESGFTFRRAFRQNRTQNIGKGYDDDRAQDMRFQIGQSKAIRNVIKNATPRGLTNLAVDKARELVRDGISADGVEKTREKILKAFKLMDVSLEQLAEFTGISDPVKWSIDVLERLTTLGKGLKNGEVQFQEAFPEKAVEQAPAPTEEKKPRRTRSDKGKPKNKAEEQAPDQEPKDDSYQAEGTPEIPEEPALSEGGVAGDVTFPTPYDREDKVEPADTDGLFHSTL